LCVKHGIDAMVENISFHEEELKDFASRVRKRIIKATYKAGVSHIGGSLSVVELLTCLYNGVLNINQENLLSRKRDQFILSKGHSALALYSVLAEKGFIEETLFEEYGVWEETILGIHPELGVPGIDAATGSLGHGLAIGIGQALAFKMQGLDYKVWVLTGDGEFNEGTNWECLPLALRYQLDNLVLIIDRNQLQLSGFTEELHPLDPLDKKLRAFGWPVEMVDGHDFPMLWELLVRVKEYRGCKPTVIIAKTVKGKGVSELENKVESHYCGVPREVAEKYLGVLPDE